MYNMQVFVTENEEDVGNAKERLLVKTCGVVEIPSYMDSVCIDCCTNEKNGGLNRYKAFAMIRIGNVIAASASIETKYGRLCGAGTPVADTVAARQMCFAGLLEHGYPKRSLPVQAQCGWTHYRENGSEDKAVYVEITDGLGNIEIHYFDERSAITVPAEGDFHDYEVTRPYDTVIVAIYDESYWVFPERYWLGYTMELATWQGEISGRETDMPGTWNHPCHFDRCRYRAFGGEVKSGAFVNSSEAGDTLGVTPQSGNRPAEWGIGFNSGTGDFWIYDRIPFGEE
jgi:hypothetical protein